jgi:hypothetical protein
MRNTRSENIEAEAKMAEDTIDYGEGSEDPDSDNPNGPRARLQERAGRALEVSTDYLRGHDIDDMRSDLEREIRAHPIKSIAIALGAGYVIGRLFK